MQQNCAHCTFYLQVIEAVFENLDIKKEVFSKLDKICKPSAIMCTNTSTIDIDRVSLTENLSKVGHVVHQCRIINNYSQINLHC